MLGIPTSGSAEEVHQLIEARLGEREDPNVQVYVEETLQLQTLVWQADSNGVIPRSEPSIVRPRKEHVMSQCNSFDNYRKPMLN